MTQDTHDIIVIGAGIIGVSTALRLASQGRKVLLVDRKGVAQETSRGNAGAFAFSEVEPLATPGIMRKAPKWLIDPLGPLSVPPSYAIRILPWMLRFWRSSWKDRYENAVEAQTSLMHHCAAAFERQLVAFGDPALIRREGQLQLYEGAAAFKAALPLWKRREELGIPFDLLTRAEEIREIQPGLSDRFTHAGFTPGWFNTTDPLKWTEKLAQAFFELGGALRISTVSDIQLKPSCIQLETEQGLVSGQRVVICAGAWSHRLARMIGDKFPLETERGYNTTFETSSVDLKTHVSFSAHGFVMSKIGEGLRIGGAVELGGLELPPNFRRAEALVSKAKTFFPTLQVANGEHWMGYRPSLPDSLPVIGASPSDDRVLYAFGHGHLGLTQSAGTAELAADLIAGTEPDINLSPFSAKRF
ncbi:FAD-dependent oxidoreductase [uncultured Aliiroseovarius sp.]|uniref:NAD(P)/FAD-dependent oxidoreductase n=1 Tax=uncultured Aliiroseovarius sp. TaxID=1658783 RepID=UPI0026225CE6|nr:FAD-dependent oxidoreductase [uncultured Aliiroseovarius sp.]